MNTTFKTGDSVTSTGRRSGRKIHGVVTDTSSVNYAGPGNGFYDIRDANGDGYTVRTDTVTGR